ncbi:MAG: glutamate-cysteine ligase family protein [bacterium]|nr:glutamate-cysteine ligase family protein [bacterium]
MNYCKLETEERLEYSNLTDEFYGGCKTEQKIGMEYERIPVYKSDGEVVPYKGEFGIGELLREIAKINNWDYILDNNNIIGLKKLHDTITLEPGCQFELSLKPQNTIAELKNKIEEIDFAISPALEYFGIKLLNIGVSPKTTYRSIELLPKRRYHSMAKYLWGILSDVMMRETAGIQVGIDYKSEDDAMKKFRLANLMTPFATAMFANSKIRGGVDTGYKSFRALAWLNTDNERCGFATDFDKNMQFEDYVALLLKTPMIFINRNEKLININGKIDFKEFMDKGFEGFIPTLEDWKLHSNLYFPEVRLRNFIEIRNHDCVGGGLEYSIPALYKGIMYSKDAISEVDSILNKYTTNEIKELRYNIPRHAINARIKNKPILDICKELCEISYYVLKSNGLGEEIFLNPLIEMLKKGKVPCEMQIT